MSATRIDAFIAALPPWQRDNLTRFRDDVRRVAPSSEEGWKWDVPVFLVGGRPVCAMSAFAKHTKYNFFAGASLADPDHLFNSGLDSKRSRSINLAEGEIPDAAALARLLTEAFTAAEATPGKGG
ncbi:MAG: DUF1801 domain-containing protein [Candidatus Dormibacteraeota bacterium]|nr:DUF1801 domain-containing protein [Candidatus Dormibacteraeota bacterium]